MNDRARDALVAAALKGTPQMKGWFRDRDGGPARCAMGVIADHSQKDGGHDVWKWAGMSREEVHAVVRANDDLGWDFLTIARKFRGGA